MKTKLISIGKTKLDWIQAGVAEYQKRLKHYCRFELVELPGLKKTAKLSHEEIARKEGELLLAKVVASDFLVLLDVDAKTLDSEAFAKWIERHSSRQQVVFVIGGAYGFSKAVYERANYRFSLSPMTFSHQLVRLVFLEQLYRGHTILQGEPYHH